jgi:hypothetical protein
LNYFQANLIILIILIQNYEKSYFKNKGKLR